MRFSVGCEIGYDIGQSATLIFNIEAMRGGRQTIINEQLVISPSLVADEKTAIETGNRYVRLTAPRGQPARPGFDHAKYDAIGESDRMTLRFKKPL